MKNLEKIYKSSGSTLEFAKGYIEHLMKILKKIDNSEIANMIEIFIEARKRESTIYFVGNGGSASTASHFANDLSIGSKCMNPPIRAISLCDNISILTAIGNDFGYDMVFVKQLEKLMKKNDVIVAISASGNSPNVIKSIEYANENNGISVGLTGFEGGKLRKISKHVVHVPTDKGEYGPVEDVHMILDHLSGSFLKNICENE